jgi:hypothetical protein
VNYDVHLRNESNPGVVYVAGPFRWRWRAWLYALRSRLCGDSADIVRRR